MNTLPHSGYAFIAVAVLVMGGILAVSAQSGPEKDAVPSPAVERPNPSSATVETTGYERGNLSEVGGHEILATNEFARAVALSNVKPVLVFKHSTECSISGAAYRRVAAWAKAKGAEVPGLFLVKVIERRPLSQEIEKRSGIKHESPQAILFSGGKPVWNASHEAVTGDAIDAALRALNSAKDHAKPTANP